MPYPQSSCVIIGISGASASGKSLIATTIYEEVSMELGQESIGVITEDCYYRDFNHLPPQEREHINYDHPSSLEHELLLKHLKKISAGHVVEIPQWSFAEHARKKEKKSFKPTKILILEGILLLSDPKLREFMDISIFIDTPLDICLIRRLCRDVKERGRTMESVLKQYQETVRPMFFHFIEPSKQYADIIIPRGGKNRIAIDMIKAKIKHLLNNDNTSLTTC